MSLGSLFRLAWTLRCLMGSMGKLRALFPNIRLALESNWSHSYSSMTLWQNKLACFQRQISRVTRTLLANIEIKTHLPSSLFCSEVYLSSYNKLECLSMPRIFTLVHVFTAGEAMICPMSMALRYFYSCGNIKSNRKYFSGQTI